MAFKFNVFTGNLDIAGTSGSVSTPDNFSYTYIVTGQTVTVPQYQQMLHVGSITVDGTLVVDGQVYEVNA